MFSHNGKISARQIMLLLILQMFNMGILILPKICVMYAGRNGYILPLIAIIIGIIYLLCIVGLTNRFPRSTFAEITEQVLPLWIARILIFIFTIKLVVSLGLELRLFGQMISQVMLEDTPLDVIILAMVLAIAYLAKSGMETVARMGEILSYFVFIPLIIIILVVSTKVNYREMMPFFQTDVTNVCKGTAIVSLWFMPLELLLITAGLMRSPKRAFKSGVIAIIFVGILEAILVLFTVCKVGVNETGEQIWPLITLMRSIGTENSVVDKQEIIIIMLWVFTTFIYAAVSMSAITILLGRTFKFKRENVFVLPIMVIVYFIAVLPIGLTTIFRYYMEFRYYYGIWFLIPVPIVLLMIAMIRRKGNEA